MAKRKRLDRVIERRELEPFDELPHTRARCSAGNRASRSTGRYSSCVRFGHWTRGWSEPRASGSEKRVSVMRTVPLRDPNRCERFLHRLFACAMLLRKRRG
jgi:hypothetical protein